MADENEILSHSHRTRKKRMHLSRLAGLGRISGGGARVSKEGAYREKCDQAWRVVAKAQLAEAKAEAEEEKSRRIYYQNIVYALADQIDGANGVKAGTGLLAGRMEEPCHEIKIALEKIIQQRNRAREVLKSISDDIAGLKRVLHSLSEIL